MDIRDIRTWADAHSAHGDLDASTLGVAGTLLNLILNQAILLNRSISQHPCTTRCEDDPRAIHREIERLVLWKSRFSGPDRDLDTILSKSLELQHCVVLSLHGLGSAIVKRVACLETNLSELQSRITDLQRLMDQAAVILDINSTDADPPESDDDSPSPNDGRGLAEDMSWYIDCLNDLSSTLESPVVDLDLADSTHQQLEPFSVSSPEALAFCRRIRDRFEKASTRLVERLGEANAERTRQLKAARDQHEAAERSAEVAPSSKQLAEPPDFGTAPSEALFSESIPKPTETTLSSFRRESVFDTASASPADVSGSKQGQRTTETDDEASVSSYVTYISQSTTFSTASLGRPRVPPVPDTTPEGLSFTCPFCQQPKVDISTRRDWKRHVYVDLRPYVCTVENCGERTTLFNSFRAWTLHEGTHRPGVGERKVCPFCDYTSELSSAAEYSHHVGKHLREISLAALAAHCGFLDGSDTSTDDGVASDGDDGDSILAQPEHKDASSPHSYPVTGFPPHGKKSKQSAVDDQNRVLLDSLRFDEMDSRLLSVKNTYAKTCMWLINHREYVAWLDPKQADDNHNLLWIYGKAGVGKSTLVKFAMQNAQKTMRDAAVISFFFTAHGTELERSTNGMYRSLLAQLFHIQPGLRDVLGPSYFESLNSGSGYAWDAESLKILFESIICSVGSMPVICFIDALDECDQNQVLDMVAFFKQLGRSAVSSGVRFHALFSSRDFTFGNGAGIILESEHGHYTDIASYIESKLRDAKMSALDQIAIRDIIISKISGIFLWAVLLVKDLQPNLRHDQTEVWLRKKLRKSSGSLWDFLRDISPQDSHQRKGWRLYMEWILFAARPLNAEELYAANMNFYPTPQAYVAQVSTEVIEDFVHSYSQGLTEIVGPEVRFVHESVKEFFLEECRSSVWPDPAELPGEGGIHGRLATRCMNYIDAHVGQILDAGTLVERMKSGLPVDASFNVETQAPFLRYSAENVLHHAEKAHVHAQPAFLRKFSKHNWVKARRAFGTSGLGRGLAGSLLYILAVCNKPALIRAMPPGKTCFEAEDGKYGPPIFAAMALNNMEAVKALVEKHLGAEPPSKLLRYIPNLLDELGEGSELRNPEFKFSPVRGVRSYVLESNCELLWSAFFLTPNADADSRDDATGNTPLELGARKGYDKFLRILLGKKRVNVNTNTRDPVSGKTPLCLAAEGGHEAIVDLLLVYRADMALTDAEGMTALDLARKNEHDSIVDKLVEEERRNNRQRLG